MFDCLPIHDRRGRPMPTLGPVEMRGMEEDRSKQTIGKKVLRLIKLHDPILRILVALGVSTDVDLLRSVSAFTATVLHIILVVSFLGTIGLDIRPLVTTLGLSGFVIGFALKEICQNMLSGALLVVQRPFRVGWTIKVGAYMGKVSAIDSRYVYLTNEDGCCVLIPSYKVYSSEIIILSTSSKPKTS
eukprot:TRINITY_DN210_c1_g1_i1.p2 TRINITY_DN210_c1_g1~~TRINITY_DN210_c1_g1_i1.p2  ORF type:complete len:187 (+),score=57.78 TRINITY_DN210_c1_g1_i1:303-863(+)